MPVFRGVKKAGTGLRAFTAPGRTPYCLARLKQAVSDPDSQPGRHLLALEHMLGADSIAKARILNSDNKAISDSFSNGDRQIIAIGKSYGAKVVISGDSSLRNNALRVGMQSLTVEELELPPSARKHKFELVSERKAKAIK